MTNPEHLQAARDAAKVGQRNLARQLLCKIVQADVTNGEAWHLLGQVLDQPDRIAYCERRARAAGFVQSAMPPPSPVPPRLPVLPRLPEITPAQKAVVTTRLGKLGAQIEWLSFRLHELSSAWNWTTQRRRRRIERQLDDTRRKLTELQREANTLRTQLGWR
jgi:hypothetical protein